MTKNRTRAKRKNGEPPPAVAKQGWRFHHLGIPYRRPRPGERHIPHLKIFVSGFETSPFGVEWIRFETRCPLPALIRKVPHLAFVVDDLKKALQGKRVVVPPNSPSDGLRVAMIVHDGAPVELMEFTKAPSRRRPKRKL
ncbi:MAG: hypothetical protein AB1439_00455 [candidate division FCPU426 bacterium]